MEFVFLVFVIAVLNLVLGYWLAVFWGIETHSVSRIRRAFRPAHLTGRASVQGDGVIGKRVQEPSPTEQTAFPPRDSPPSLPEQASDPVLEPELTGLDAFRLLVATSISSLSGFAARLKKSSRGNQARTGWAFVAELQGICQPYMEKLQQAPQRLADEVGNDVQDLVLEQLAQLETTLGNLQYMDFGADAAGASVRLSQETANTLSMARKLQQALEAAPGTADPGS